MARESTIQAQIRATLNRDGRCRLFRNSVGYDAGNRVRYGLSTGSPDLVGVLRNGICFAIECKTPRGRLSPEQAAWWRAAAKWGIRGGVAHSVEEALQLLEAACSDA